MSIGLSGPSDSLTPEGAVGGAPFVTTHWSVVLTARGENDGCQQALAKLCQAYWQPLYTYIRRRGYSREDAEDLTQEFFARLLERKAVARADPERGRFRSFLLGSLKNFLANEWEKAHTRKRGGHLRMMSLDFDTAETQCCQPEAPGDTPDRAFDRQWALALLDLVLNRLRDEYKGARRDDVFAVLKDTLSGGRSEIPYRELAARLRMSEGAVKVAAHRLRQRYRELLREQIAQTVANSDDVERELRDLFAALGS